MDKSKRILSIILSIFMLFSIVNPASLIAADETKPVESNEIKGKRVGDKEVFTFKLPESNTVTTKSVKKAPRRAPQNFDTTVTIVTEGLNGGQFDWSALPNEQFSITAKWETKDGQNHEKELSPAITAEGITQYYVGWPIDGTLTGNAEIVTDFNQKVEVRVLDTTSFSTPDGQGGLKFTIELTELAESRAKVEYVDPYGRQLTDTNDLPASTDTMPKVTVDELTDVEIELPKKDGQINMRSSGDLDDDELNTAADGLTYKVGGKADEEEVKIGEKEYIVDISQPSAKEIATIKMVYQKDVVVPPIDDDGNPVDPATGYVRLTFDANENKQDGITGTHQVGDYTGKQLSYIDVKKGTTYDNANLKAAIKDLKVQGTKNQIAYEQDTTQAWEDENKAAIPTTGAVTAKTYYARYAKSDKDIIPYVPDNPDDPTNPDDKNVPTEDEDNNPIDKSEYDIVAFK
ncbi:MAG: hypothetical protein SPI61_03975, partial [Ezakiella sp.]|uniref:hypothetical protein n=1 Tax=Ezakiella sp. TaxID=1935205 RepID=UPI0029717168